MLVEGLDHHLIDWRNFGVPTGEQVNAALARMKVALDQNKAIAVHCFAGTQ